MRVGLSRCLVANRPKAALHIRQKTANSGGANSPDTQGIHPGGTQMHAMNLDIVKSSLFLTVQAWECAGNVKPVSACKWKSVKS
jgi:hypothetical protein